MDCMLAKRFCSVFAIYKHFSQDKKSPNFLHVVCPGHNVVDFLRNKNNKNANIRTPLRVVSLLGLLLISIFMLYSTAKFTIPHKYS